MNLSPSRVLCPGIFRDIERYQKTKHNEILKKVYFLRYQIAKQCVAREKKGIPLWQQDQISEKS